MTAKQSTDFHNWTTTARLPSEVQFHICGSLFSLDKERLAVKSEKVTKLLQKGHQENLSHLLQDIPSWNKSIIALKRTESVLQQASELGLVNCCVESIVMKVLEDPHLLGEPIGYSSVSDDSDENENGFGPTAPRKHLDLNWKSEDITVLSLRLYEYIIQTMVQFQVPQEYLAANLCEYAKQWVFSKKRKASVYLINSQREVVESLERLLPQQRGVLPCTFLFEMLQSATALDAGPECKNGLEIRIGMQLDKASVKDLLIPYREYSKDEKYDIDCVIRIFKNFYSNYTGPGDSGLLSVADLINEFLAEISAETDLKMSTFIAVADIVKSVAVQTGKLTTSDGIYRSIDIYLDKHRHLTVSEREELCSVLDIQKLSPAACEHAAQNDKLPVRVVVKVLFLGQLKLRNIIAKEVNNLSGGSLKVAEGRILGVEEEVMTEIEQMENKVLDLERECCAMRREIWRGADSGVKRPRESIWEGMKRKLGCATTTTLDSNCHIRKKKKVHPK